MILPGLTQIKVMHGGSIHISVIRSLHQGSIHDMLGIILTKFLAEIYNSSSLDYTSVCLSRRLCYVKLYVAGRNYGIIFMIVGHKQACTIQT